MNVRKKYYIIILLVAIFVAIPAVSDYINSDYCKPNDVLLQDNDRIEVNLSEHIDGDTSRFIINEKETVCRYLAIDCPETVHPYKKIQEYGTEASSFTKDRLLNAHRIQIEYEYESSKVDKYDRDLVWVFVDGELLQEQLLRNGLAKIAYAKSQYKYMLRLEEAENYAKNHQLGIWGNN